MKTDWRFRQLNNYRNKFFSIREDKDRLNFLIHVYNNTMIQRGEELDALIVDLCFYFINTPLEDESGRFFNFLTKQGFLGTKNIFK